MNDLAKRIADQNQANLNSSVANVEIANYALQLATLTSPITGIVTHEDVNVAGQNVTTATKFVVADPTTKVFRVDVPASDIDYISEGMTASILLDGEKNKINGTIIKISPAAVVNQVSGGTVQALSGQVTYQVDIQADDITSNAKLDQSGTAIIMTNAENVTLIPTWTVLGGKYVWVINNNKPVLRSITVGKTHGDQIEVTSGLATGDRVITDPKLIPSRDYQLL